MLTENSELYLNCRFSGWILPGLVTAGTGFLWVGPYMPASFFRFYRDLLDNKANTGSTNGEVPSMPAESSTGNAAV